MNDTDLWTPKTIRRIIFWHRVRCFLTARCPYCVRHWHRGHRPDCSRLGTRR